MFIVFSFIEKPELVSSVVDLHAWRGCRNYDWCNADVAQ